MNEEKWSEARDPAPLIEWLVPEFRPADRKLRLFSLACCSRVSALLPEGSARLLRLIGEMADGRVDNVELERRRRSILLEMRWPASARPRTRWHACNAVLAASSPVDEREPLYVQASEYQNLFFRRVRGPYVKFASEAAFFAHESRDQAEALAVQVRLLRDIFGPLPFRDMTADPAWLTRDVLLLAGGIYDEKAFDRMPILADALQDAGCDNDDVLSHCRDTSLAHVRGCWVIDLLLGRPWRDTVSG